MDYNHKNLLDTLNSNTHEESLVNIFKPSKEFGNVFGSNRYSYALNSCDAEIETKIQELAGTITVHNTKHFKNKHHKNTVKF